MILDDFPGAIVRYEVGKSQMREDIELLVGGGVDGE